MSVFQPLTEGVFHELDESVYRNAPGVSISALKHMKRSPAHYLQSIACKREPSAAQIIGTVIHGLCLEPHRTLHVVRPEGLSFQTKEGKRWRDEQTLPVLTTEDDLTANRAASAILAHPIAGEIIRRADKEVSVFKDHPCGVLRKGRLDLVFCDDSDMTTVADIKTCEDASEFAFAADARKYGYSRQAAYYLDLIGASNFLFIAVEKSAPFGVQVFQVAQETIERGRAQYERDIEMVAQCEVSGEWPAYPAAIKPLTIREWID